MSSKKKRRKKRKSRNEGVTVIQSKQKNARNHANRLNPGTSQALPSDLADEIHRLISKGKAKVAVSRVKLYHKHHGTEESEMILVETYAARICEMMDKKYHVEAKTLLELISER